MKKLIPILLIALLLLTSCNNIVSNPNEETTEPFTTDISEISSTVGDETTVIDDPTGTIIDIDGPFTVPASPYTVQR